MLVVDFAFILAFISLLCCS